MRKARSKFRGSVGPSDRSLRVALTMNPVEYAGRGRLQRIYVPMARKRKRSAVETTVIMKKLVNAPCRVHSRLRA